MASRMMHWIKSENRSAVTTACGRTGVPGRTQSSVYVTRWTVFHADRDKAACTCRTCLGITLKRGKRRKAGLPSGVEVRVKRKHTRQDGKRVIG